MNNLIKYKNKVANLDNLFDIYCYDNESKPNIYCIVFEYLLVHPDGDSLIDKSWHFNTAQERDKAYNYILDTYFTDIEKLINEETTK